MSRGRAVLISIFWFLVATAPPAAAQDKNFRILGNIRQQVPILVEVYPNTANALPFLHTQGTHVVNEQNQPVQLRGINLGSWLLIEPWMLMCERTSSPLIVAEKQLWDILNQRFGAAQTQAWLRLYREQTVTKQDIAYIKSLGFNLVRVPIWWRMIADPNYMGEGLLYLDRLVSWCEQYGVYCIFDLHGAPGGQSNNYPTLGEYSNNMFWSTPENLTAAKTFWTTLVERYKNRGTVAGYDILNEPFGAPGLPYFTQDLIGVYDQLYQTIRALDTQHIIFIEDAPALGLHRLPLPQSMNWQNVVYSTHVYTQKTGDDEAFIQDKYPNLKRAQRFYQVPFDIGEFSTIRDPWGGTAALQKWIYLFTRHGWMYNVWSLKKKENQSESCWAILGYNSQNATLDPSTANSAALTNFFASMNIAGLSANPNMVTALTYSNAVPERPAPAWDLNNRLRLSAEAATIIRGVNGELRLVWTYQAATDPNLEYWKMGDSLFWDLNIPTAGVYEIWLRYASKAQGSRLEIWIDNRLCGNFVENSTNDWAIYQDVSLGTFAFTAGPHQLRLFAAQDANYGFLNLRYAEIRPGSGSPTLAPQENHFTLTPFEAGSIERVEQLCVEWQNNPPNFGTWSDPDAVVWNNRLTVGGNFNAYLEYSSPNASQCSLTVGAQTLTHNLAATGGWNNYQKVNLGVIALPAGGHTLRLQFTTGNGNEAGNFRNLEFIRQ